LSFKFLIFIKDLLIIDIYHNIIYYNIILLNYYVIYYKFVISENSLIDGGITSIAFPFKCLINLLFIKFVIGLLLFQYFIINYIFIYI